MDPSNTSPAWLQFARYVTAAAVLTGVALAFMGLSGHTAINAVRDTTRIVHSNFVYIIWPFALLGLLWSGPFVGIARRISGIGVAFSICGALLSFIVPWGGMGAESIKALPLVRHPLHGAAMVVFLAGILLSLTAWLLSRRREGACVTDGLSWYAVVPLAVLVFSAAWLWTATAEMSEELRLSTIFLFAQLQLPLVQGALLLRGWFWLFDRGDHDQGLSLRWQHIFMFLSVLPVFAVVPLLMSVNPAEPDFLSRFDSLISWTSWPAVVMCGLVLTARVLRSWSARRSSVARYTFLASCLIFVLGALAGLVSDETGALYLAQAHWTSGAVAVAYCVLLFGVRGGAVHGEGQFAKGTYVLAPLMISFGLLLAGAGSGLVGLIALFNVQTAGGQALVPMELLQHSLLVVGAGLMLTAAGGGVSYALANARLITAQSGGWGGALRSRFGRMDSRLRAVLATALAIGMIGGIIALLPSQIGMDAPEGGAGLRSENHEHVVVQMRGEVKERFDQGVVMLHARRYDEAATAFHRVLALAPEMPEAHVNMGFAMLGKEDYKLALDFFEGATELRVNQLNAYYGMALAYEGLGNIEAAAGAMKSYQHLTAPDDPFLPKVNAKLQQYEQQRGARPPAAGA